MLWRGKAPCRVGVFKHILLSGAIICEPWYHCLLSIRIRLTVKLLYKLSVLAHWLQQATDTLSSYVKDLIAWGLYSSMFHFLSDVGKMILSHI